MLVGKCFKYIQSLPQIIQETFLGVNEYSARTVIINSLKTIKPCDPKSCKLNFIHKLTLLSS